MDKAEFIDLIQENGEVNGVKIQTAIYLDIILPESNNRESGWTTSR